VCIKTPDLKNIKRIEHFVKHKLGVPNLDWQKFPKVIQVSSTNKCPLGSCTYCHPWYRIRKGELKVADMPFEWMQWILKEVNRDGRTMSFLAWFLDGDIDVRLPEILDLSKKVCPWLPNRCLSCDMWQKSPNLFINYRGQWI